AARDVFDGMWDVSMLDEVIEHFDKGGVLQISDGASAEACLAGLAAVNGLNEALEGAGLSNPADPAMTVAAAELLLEGLAAHRKISRAESGAYGRAKAERPKGKGAGGFKFGDDMFS
ncbi:MAG TPA: hypothetical protein VIB55_15590, partial [Longimicrobium sp.]